MPGHEKIDSIAITRPTHDADVERDQVTTGSSAFGTACWRITRRRVLPIARAVR